MIMKLIKIFFVLLVPVLLMAEESYSSPKILGINVSLINIFWETYSRNRDNLSIDEYYFSIEENSDFYIVNCQMDVDKIREKYRKKHPNEDMTEWTVKGGCGWGKISKDSLKMVEKQYFK